MGVKISALPTATQAEAASGLIPVVTDPNGDGNLITKHVTASSIGGGATVDTGTTPPSNPGNGDLWFDEGNAELYIYNTSINGWIQTNGGGGGGDDTSTSSVVGARAVFNGVTTTPMNGSTFAGSFNIDRVEVVPAGADKIYFTNPIEDPVIMIPDFQPDYDTTPFSAFGISQRITTASNSGPSYQLSFQDNASNILLSMSFTQFSAVRHFVIF